VEDCCSPSGEASVEMPLDSTVDAAHPLVAPGGEHPGESEEQRSWEARNTRLSRERQAWYYGFEIEVHDYVKSIGEDAGDYTEIFQLLNGLRDTPAGTNITILDAGANLGMVSVAMCRFIKAHLQHLNVVILAMEPVLSTFRYMTWNVRSNDCADVVWPINAGLSSDGREIELSVSPACSNMAAIDEDHMHVHCPGIVRVLIPTLAVADLIASFISTPTIEIAKFDCEGCEYDFVRPSVSRWLLDTRVRWLVTEFHGSEDLAADFGGYERGSCLAKLHHHNTKRYFCSMRTPDDGMGTEMDVLARDAGHGIWICTSPGRLPGRNVRWLGETVCGVFDTKVYGYSG